MRNYICSHFAKEALSRKVKAAIEINLRGGFVTGTVKSHRYFCTTVLNYAGIDGFSMEYTQHPEGRHHEELVDAVRVYKGLQLAGYKP